MRAYPIAGTRTCILHCMFFLLQLECTFTNACAEPQGALFACCKIKQCAQLVEIGELAAAVRAWRH